MPFLALLPIGSVVSFVTKNWRLCLIVLAIVLLLIAALHERSVLIQRGKDEATQQIDQANQEEMQRANQAQNTVDGCYAANGDWDRSRGVCVGPAGK